MSYANDTGADKHALMRSLQERRLLSLRGSITAMLATSNISGVYLASVCDIGPDKQKRILGESRLISSLPGKALRTLGNIARLAERFNKRSQSRAW